MKLIFLLIINLVNGFIYPYQYNNLYKSKYLSNHYCIPLNLINNTLINELQFDLYSSDNIILMPTYKGVKYLNLHPNRHIIYQGFNRKYSEYVKYELNIINNYDNIDNKKYNFWLFLMYLKNNLNKRYDEIPW